MTSMRWHDWVLFLLGTLALIGFTVGAFYLAMVIGNSTEGESKCERLKRELGAVSGASYWTDAHGWGEAREHCILKFADGTVVDTG